MTTRIIPLARAKGMLAEFRRMEASYRQAKFVLVELAAALESIAPNSIVYFKGDDLVIRPRHKKELLVAESADWVI